MPLVPCTPNPVEGQVLAALPGVEVHDDVLYNPIHDHRWHDDPQWGVYDRDGRLLDAAAYYRGPGKATVGGSARLDRRAIAADEAPDATYIYGGVLIEHFGHFMLSSISRFWPFLEAAGDAAGNAAGLAGLGRHRILCHGVFGPDHWWSFPYMSETLGALGLTRDRFLDFKRPTRIKRLIVPRPSFEEHNFVHTAYARLARTIGARLLQAEGGTAGRRGPAFLSRTRYPKISQGFANEHEVEAALAALGVQVVHPEALSIAGQVRAFAEHPVIAGQVSSAFHSAIYAPRAGRLLMLSPTYLVNPNFAMLDRVGGLRAEYYFLDPEVVARDSPERIINQFRIRDTAGLLRDLLPLLQAACGGAEAATASRP